MPPADFSVFPCPNFPPELTQEEAQSLSKKSTGYLKKKLQWAQARHQEVRDDIDPHIAGSVIMSIRYTDHFDSLKIWERWISYLEKLLADRQKD